VQKAIVTLSTNQALVEYDVSVQSAKALQDEIESVGFGAEILQVKGTSQPTIRYVKFAVDGMTCSSCSNSIEKLLQSLGGGITEANVTLSTNQAFVEYDASKLSSTQIKNEIESIGYDVEILEDGSSTPTKGRSEETSDPDNNEKSVLMIVSKCGSETTEAVSDEESARLIIMLEKLHGVISAGRYMNGFQMTFRGNDTGPRNFAAKLKTVGYDCEFSSFGGFMAAERLTAHNDKEFRHLLTSTVVCGMLALPTLVIGMFLPMNEQAKGWLDIELVPGLNIYGLLLLLLCTPIQWGIGLRFHVKAIKSVKSGTLGMDFLISTGTTAAYLFSFCGFIRGLASGSPSNEEVEYFETSAVLIFVVILGKLMEAYAKGVTASAIRSLSAMQSRDARLVTENPRHRTEYDAIVNESENPIFSIIEEGESGIDAENMWEKDGEEKLSKYEDSNASGDRMIDSSLIHNGDTLRLVEGETIPADGVVPEGGSGIGVDESMMTGESRIVYKSAGDSVFGGTIVVEGSTLIEVTACGDSSTLGKIVATVQEAQASKPPIQEVADRVARYFVPIIAGISLTTFTIWMIAYAAGAVPSGWYNDGSKRADAGAMILFAFLFALAVWVSACPCAFGLATPTAVLVSTGVAAKLGVLIRKGAALQFASNVDTVAFDKTGTLTNGKTQVSEFTTFDSAGHEGDDLMNTSTLIQGADGHSLDVKQKMKLREHCFTLKLLLTAEMRSNHPLSQGISEFCHDALLTIADTLRGDGYASTSSSFTDPFDGELEVVPGRGLRLTLAGMSRMNNTWNISTRDEPKSNDSLVALIGSSAFMLESGVDLPFAAQTVAAHIRAGGKVAVYMAIEGCLRAIVGVSDTLRPEAAYVISALKRQGITSYMITGDERATAEAIAAAVRIPSTNIYARATPGDKEALIASLQKEGRTVAFIGDGTNDSPALARANVGIAMSGMEA
jgi:Cu+-exporting ATPase